MDTLASNRRFMLIRRGAHRLSTLRASRLLAKYGLLLRAIRRLQIPYTTWTLRSACDQHADLPVVGWFCLASCKLINFALFASMVPPRCYVMRWRLFRLNAQDKQIRCAVMVGLFRAARDGARYRAYRRCVAYTAGAIYGFINVGDAIHSM